MGKSDRKETWQKHKENRIRERNSVPPALKVEEGAMRAKTLENARKKILPRASEGGWPCLILAL